MTGDEWKPCTSHVVILDNDPEDARDVAKVLNALFADNGLYLLTDAVTRSTELLGFLNTHPDVVFCDISLDGQNDIKGLTLIQNYKAKFPHITFAAMTGNLEQLEKLSQITTEPDYIVPKGLLIPDIDKEYRVRLLELILRNTRQNRYFRLSMETEAEATLKKAFAWNRFDRATVQCLVRQVFSTNIIPFSSLEDLKEFEGASVARNLIQHVHVKQFQPGRSGSAVFLARSIIDGIEQDVSVVLKFCSGGDFSQELRNYARYVKWTLPYAWRVDVLGVGRVKNFGVIGYSLAFAGSAGAQPLAHYLEIGDRERVEAFVCKAFDENQKVWYRNPQLLDGDLRQGLVAKYFASSRAKFNQQIGAALDRVEGSATFIAWKPKQARGGTRLALHKKIDAVFRQEWKPYTLCVCHGDLHAGNVMMSKEGAGMAFIDFQDTGLLHVYTDFVFFENAIRKDGSFDWTRPEMALPTEIAEINAALDGSALDPDKHLPVGHALVRLVRQKAFLNFNESREYYFVHALMFSILMITNVTSGEEAIERISSFVIACSEILAERLGGL